ncbi:MAG: ComEC/Rec2 family competence protein [Bacillota bacterium]|nr:ComEC/Rec2 family competence protein [Bacillota bacterium]
MPPAPLVWMAGGWAIAGLLGIGLRPEPEPGLAAALLLLMATAGAVAVRWRSGAALGLAALALGLLLVAARLGALPGPSELERLEARRCAVARVESASLGERSVEATLRFPAAATSWNGRAEARWRGGEAPAPGDRLRLCGRLLFPRGPDNPGGLDPRRELAGRGVRARFEVEGRPRLLAGGSAWGRLGAEAGRAAAALRASAVEVLERSLPAQEAAVVASLLLGDRSGVDAGLEEAFQLTGLVHLLSVSGLHVGFLLPWLELPWRRWGLAARWLGLAGGLVGYAALTGGEAPVWRAAVMALAFRGAAVLGRRPHAGSALALAYLLLTGSRPERAGELGLQLSFAATAGILAARPLLERAGRSGLARPLRWLVQGLLVSLAAQAAVAPLLADRFGRAGPWGPLLNLAAGPLVGLLLPYGLAGLLLASLHPLFAPALAPAGLLARWLRLLVEAGAALPGAERLLPPPGWAALPWYAALAGAWALAAGWPGGLGLRRALLAGTLAAGGVALLLWFVPSAPRPAVPEVLFLAVGQGDAALVRMPDGFTLLVDAGPDRAPGTAEILRRMRLRRLDAVAVSHADADHAGGLPELLRALPVGEIWLGDPPVAGDRLLAEAVRLAGERGIPLRHVEEGWVAERPGLRIRVLNPPRSRQLAWEQNDRSMVLELLFPSAGGRAETEPPAGTGEAGEGVPSLLMTADLPAEGEARLLDRAGRIRGQILKVAHHGSAGSSSRRWLEALHPREAVVSVGPNRYGHPARGTLERLRQTGARIWRTDRDGAVRARRLPEGWRLEAMHRREAAGE